MEKGSHTQAHSYRMAKAPPLSAGWWEAWEVYWAPTGHQRLAGLLAAQARVMGSLAVPATGCS